MSGHQPAGWGLSVSGVQNHDSTRADSALKIVSTCPILRFLEFLNKWGVIHSRVYTVVVPLRSVVDLLHPIYFKLLEILELVPVQSQKVDYRDTHVHFYTCLRTNL